MLEIHINNGMMINISLLALPNAYSLLGIPYWVSPIGYPLLVISQRRKGKKGKRERKEKGKAGEKLAASIWDSFDIHTYGRQARSTVHMLHEAISKLANIYIYIYIRQINIYIYILMFCIYEYCIYIYICICIYVYIYIYIYKLCTNMYIFDTCSLHFCTCLVHCC